MSKYIPGFNAFCSGMCFIIACQAALTGDAVGAAFATFIFILNAGLYLKDA